MITRTCFLNTHLLDITDRNYYYVESTLTRHLKKHFPDWQRMQVWQMSLVQLYMYLILRAVMRLWCYLLPDNSHEIVLLFTISPLRPLSWDYNGIETRKLKHRCISNIFPYSDASLDHWLIFNALKTQRRLS